MEDKYYYTTEVEWTGERHGDLSAPVLPKLKVDAPPEFKGHEGVWTPEHLFVASVNSCFMTTFLAIAENSKLEFVSFSADAKGKLEKVADHDLPPANEDCHRGTETQRYRNLRDPFSVLPCLCGK